MIVVSTSRKLISPLAPRYLTNATLHVSSQDLFHCLDRSLGIRSPQQSHALILTTGHSQCAYLASKLIGAYSACHDPASSRLVFDSVNHKNVYLWNTLLSVYAKCDVFHGALELFREMCRGDVRFDEYTLATVSKVVSECGELVVGEVVHGKSIRTGLVWDTVLSNSLMAMYEKCGEVCEIKKLFDDMPERNVGSWNMLMAGYVGLSSDGDGVNRVWDVVGFMQKEGVRPNMYTVSILLPLCAGDTENCDYGRELHCYVLRNELDSASNSDVHFSCCLIDMYSKTCRTDVARRVFDGSKHRNVYVWTAMINGYVKNGDSEEAVCLFKEMLLVHRIKPTSVSLVSILPACVMLSGLALVRQIHAFAIRRKMADVVSLHNALIDSYCKSGSLVSARNVFDAVTSNNAVSWSSMISGYGLYGKGEEALLLYHEMLHLGIRPDHIILVSVLSACARSGMVDEGLNLYNSAKNHYGVQPTAEICSCVVDMLGRSNQLDRALDFVKNMEVEAGPSDWGALMNAALMHGNQHMRDLACRLLIHMEPENPSNLVSLSNWYAESRNWHDVAQVRKMMQERGLRKEPGCSWITIKGKTDYFYAADKVHPSCDLVYEMLDCLGLLMRGVHNTGVVELAVTS